MEKHINSIKSVIELSLEERNKLIDIILALEDGKKEELEVDDDAIRLLIDCIETVLNADEVITWGGW